MARFKPRFEFRCHLNLMFCLGVKLVSWYQSKFVDALTWLVQVINWTYQVRALNHFQKRKTTLLLPSMINLILISHLRKILVTFTHTQIVLLSIRLRKSQSNFSWSNFKIFKVKLNPYLIFFLIWELRYLKEKYLDKNMFLICIYKLFFFQDILRVQL